MAQTPFGALLQELIDADPTLTQKRFGELVGHPGAYINQIIHGSRRPPLENIERWADAANVTGQARDRFIQLAHLDHTTPLMQRLVGELTQTIDVQRQRIAGLDALLAESDAQREGLATENLALRAEIKHLEAHVEDLRKLAEARGDLAARLAELEKRYKH